MPDGPALPEIRPRSHAAIENIKPATPTEASSNFISRREALAKSTFIGAFAFTADSLLGITEKNPFVDSSALSGDLKTIIYAGSLAAGFYAYDAIKRKRATGKY